MKQKFLILLTAVMTAVIAHAYDFSSVYSGKTFYFNITSANTCEVTASPETKYSGNVVIPATATYNGVTYSVTSIGDGAFKSCYELTSAVIPGSVTKIGTNAFAFCLNLKSVNIPESVTTIDNFAFSDCSALTSVEIPNSVTSMGSIVFNNCAGLTAFYGKYASEDHRCLIVNGTLNSFAPAGVTSYTIPSTVKSISFLAFSYCSELTSIEIPNSVTSIGSNAFSQCNSLNAFYGKFASEDNRCLIVKGQLVGFARSGLTWYTIPNSVTKIGEAAFSYCRDLTSIEIPSSVTTIDSNAFIGCSGLTTVEIPNSVTYLGAYSFGRCDALKSFIVNNTDPENITMRPTVFLESPVSTCTLSVPKGSEELYAAADQWMDFGRIEGFITDITLIDGEEYSMFVDLPCVDITYTRKFEPGIWQPLYIPFNMSYDEWKDYGRVAELACVHTYEDGRTTIEFVTVNDGELVPNVPYVFLPNTGDEVTFTCLNKKIKAAPAEGTKYIMCSSPRYTFKIFGNYQALPGSILATYGDAQFNGAYVMTADNKFAHCALSSTLKPYRFYITREKTANGYWEAPARMNAPIATADDDVIYFMVDGVVCGIASVAADADGTGVVYDLMGREVKNPSNGIYIRNGQKLRIH